MRQSCWLRKLQEFVTDELGDHMYDSFQVWQVRTASDLCLHITLHQC